jgi:hypothetical protein
VAQTQTFDDHANGDAHDDAESEDVSLLGARPQAGRLCCQLSVSRSHAWQTATTLFRFLSLSFNGQYSD